MRIILALLFISIGFIILVICFEDKPDPFFEKKWHKFYRGDKLVYEVLRSPSEPLHGWDDGLGVPEYDRIEMEDL